ncbi:MAG: undecaprenyl/decaprenyl-phosphate alpha-N-acetylglucosaminyl 1-phosphate transferase [Cyanobacteria bacterium]|nr:undecaprenyl/decaprenyl-phosphate alpha-N-acetylglucosaminyl 1-phosphate transferase [Cyanobacteriota bacterium]
MIFSLILVPWVRKRAIAAGRFDTPGDRKIHQFPIPRLGGVAIWLAFMLTFWLLVLCNWNYPHGNGILGVLVGGGLFFLLGLVDDLVNLSPYVKLVGQFLAASIAFWLGVQVNTLDLPGSLVLVLNAFSFPVTVIWLMAIANSMNFIDGVDGLAGGVTTLSAVTLALVAVYTNQPIAALLAALLAGANLGFLVFNFYPAKIFMGDSGALFSGFTLAAIAVTGVLKTKVVVMLLPILVFCVPLIDITYSVFRRLSRFQNPFMADADHLHHKLLKAGNSQIRTVTYFYAICVAAGLVATGYVNYLLYYVLVLLGLVILATLLIIGVRYFYRAEAPPEANTLPSPESIQPAQN